LHHLSYTLTELLPIWDEILANWDLIPDSIKQAALQFFSERIEPNLQTTKGPAWRSTMEALDILDMPFWRHRWHTYEVWAAVKALEALDEFHPTPVVIDGHIAIDSTSPALIARFAASQSVFAHVQGETKLPKPLGKRKAIKPDLRFSVDTPATNKGTFAIVEFKQRRLLDSAHVSEVLSAYSLGVGMRGGVVLINYDQTPIVALPPSCVLLGDVHPGRPDKVAEYQSELRNFFASASILPQPGRRFVLLDVSGSMSLEYSGTLAQKGLKRLVALPWVKIYRFNDGLLDGGDLKGGAPMSTGGGTQLGATLRQLFSLQDAGIPERLLVITDGEHDHPDALLKKCGDYRECHPNDLEGYLDWLIAP
jgi:hypothetical protein